MPAQYRIFVRAPLIGLILLVCLMGLFARRGLLDWRRIDHQNMNLGARIASARELRKQLQWQIEQVQKNPEEQERVVRQFLGYIKPNETVIEFP